jgi:WD40 repeat protein
MEKMHLSRRAIVTFILYLVVILLGLIWILIGESSFWTSKLSIIFVVLGVSAAISQWRFPISPENYKPSSADAPRQGSPEFLLPEKVKEQRLKAIEHKDKLRSKQKRRRIIIGCSIALSIVFASAFVYLQFSSYIDAGPLDVPYPPNGWVTSLAWSPNGELLAIASEDGQVRLWNKANKSSITVDEIGTTINCIAWASDNKHIAYGGTDKKIKILDISTGSSATTSFGLSDEVYAIAWSPIDSRYIAFGGADNTIQVWNVMNTKQPIFIYHKNGIVRALAWSHDGKHLASADDDGKVQVWDITTGANSFTSPGYIGSVTALRWSPISNWLLASASNDDQVRVWDTTKKGFTENPVKIYKDYTASSVNDIDWSPNGSYIAIGDNEGILHIWDWSATPQRDVGSYQFHFSTSDYKPEFELTAIGWSLDSSSIGVQPH